MRKQIELEREIIRQCGESGFLVQLVARASFDDANFNKLVDALKEYDEVLGNSSIIDRYAAGCLLHLETFLGDAVFKYKDLGIPLAEQTADAHAVISDLVHRILIPPDLRGSRGRE
jgi:hypothetical protein